jgi:hypothetical protein
MAGKKVVIVGEVYDPELGIGGGPIIPSVPGKPPGIWGGGNEPFPTPPIYIPVPPPSGGGPDDPHPEHPIYIPVYPAHPIVIPIPPKPPSDAHPEHPIVYPPVVWPPLPPLGIWGPTDPRPTPPIYIPAPTPPTGGEKPEHPIYIPVYPAHPIVLPPDGEKPEPPPGMVNPPTGARGFWAYSETYGCWVFVPYEGSGLQPPASGSGGGDPHPEHPIAQPGQAQSQTDPQRRR